MKTANRVARTDWKRRKPVQGNAALLASFVAKNGSAFKMDQGNLRMEDLEMNLRKTEKERRRRRLSTSSMGSLDARVDSRLVFVRDLQIAQNAGGKWASDLEKKVEELFDLLSEEKTFLELDRLQLLPLAVFSDPASPSNAASAMARITGISPSIRCNKDKFRMYISQSLIHLREYAPRIVSQWIKQFKAHQRSKAFKAVLGRSDSGTKGKQGFFNFRGDSSPKRGPKKDKTANDGAYIGRPREDDI